MMSTEKHIYSMMIFFHFQQGVEICCSTLISSPDYLTRFTKGNMVKINDKVYVIKDIVSTEISISSEGIGVETCLISLVV